MHHTVLQTLRNELQRVSEELRHMKGDYQRMVKNTTLQRQRVMLAEERQQALRDFLEGHIAPSELQKLCDAAEEVRLTLPDTLQVDNT